MSCNYNPRSDELPMGYVYLCSPYNSTMFTTCCHVAICDNQKRCPSCGRLIIGHDASSDHDRHMLRWFYAYH